RTVDAGQPVLVISDPGVQDPSGRGRPIPAPMREPDLPQQVDGRRPERHEPDQRRQDPLHCGHESPRCLEFQLHHLPRLHQPIDLGLEPRPLALQRRDLLPRRLLIVAGPTEQRVDLRDPRLDRLQLRRDLVAPRFEARPGDRATAAVAAPPGPRAAPLPPPPTPPPPATPAPLPPPPPPPAPPGP